MQELDIREIAEKLWCIIDDIDTGSDIFKPSKNNPGSYEKFYSFVMKKQAKRFEYLTSDGYKLFTKKEWENRIRLEKLKQIGKKEKNYELDVIKQR